MNSIEAIDTWRRALASDHEDLWKAVVFALQLFELSGIPKGHSSFNIEDPNKVAFYVQDCLDAGVTAATILDHHQKVRRGFKFWPTSSEFSAAFVEYKRAATIPGDHVGYVLEANGTCRVVNRRLNPAAQPTEHEARQLAAPDIKSLC